jgi:hypothetical protein
MAVPDWPSTLPQALLVDGNQFAAPDGRLRSQTDTGPAKMRLRSSAMPMPFSGSILMDDTQHDTFEAFIAPDGDTVGGALPFNFPAQYGTGTWLVRFGEQMPTVVEIAKGIWRATLSLEKLP